MKSKKVKGNDVHGECCECLKFVDKVMEKAGEDLPSIIAAFNKGLFGQVSTYIGRKIETKKLIEGVNAQKEKKEVAPSTEVPH